MKKPLHFMGSSRDDLRNVFPDGPRTEAGFALFLAQNGSKSLDAVPLVGFRSAGVLEVAINDDGNAYRVVYTVKFREAVYVLHAFQKKSKKGIATPQRDMDLIRRRLQKAEIHYKATYQIRKATG